VLNGAIADADAAASFKKQREMLRPNVTAYFRRRDCHLGEVEEGEGRIRMGEQRDGFIPWTWEAPEAFVANETRDG